MKTINTRYYNWLISQIEINSDTKTYHGILEKMHNTEFVWIVPHDDNRIHDALDLRTEFLDGTHGSNTEDILKLEVMFKKGASALEVLIALSRSVSSLAGGESSFWAWKLMENIGLDGMSDPFTNGKNKRATDILETLIWRTYERDGRGGFFPLNWPKEDQTKIELWYQMNEYVMEIQEL